MENTGSNKIYQVSLLLASEPNVRYKYVLESKLHECRDFFLSY